jgi:hypothetical protein
VEIRWCFVLTPPSEFFGNLGNNSSVSPASGAAPTFYFCEPEALTAWWSLVTSGAGSMLKGVATATIAILALIVADEYLSNGFYTDAAMSMLKDMRYSFRW